ncbi:hypothetical protein MTY66_10050 [Mycolicibacterium sp. TY66]|nr:hypothetical protein MTY66_10050 [Mycolicibacterium sp. TY66]BCJ82959.1 hypothetical protein MTY81_43320 [Mycolicibacterium sp. TY81]
MTAGSWFALCETWPLLQPVSVTAVASPKAASVTAEVRDFMRFTQASCLGASGDARDGLGYVLLCPRTGPAFDYAE